MRIKNYQLKVTFFLESLCCNMLTKSKPDRFLNRHLYPATISFLVRQEWIGQEIGSKWHASIHSHFQIDMTPPLPQCTWVQSYILPHSKKIATGCKSGWIWRWETKSLHCCKVTDQFRTMGMAKAQSQLNSHNGTWLTCNICWHPNDVDMQKSNHIAQQLGCCF